MQNLRNRDAHGVPLSPTGHGPAAAILYCHDPLDVRSVDKHFAAEARAAQRAGGTVALLNHDTLLRGDPDAAVSRVRRDLGPLWYRGWMIPAERYADLAAALLRRGGELLVPAERYRQAHELPGWYSAFAEHTPRSVWMPTTRHRAPSIDEVAALVAALPAGPALVKDFVKSRKHEWDEACYVPNVTDVAHAHRVIRRFVRLQGDDLAGGIVVRAFEPFVTTGPDAGEARAWWLDGQPVLVGPHPDTPDRRSSPDLTAIRPAIAALGCRFITTDLALRTDGQWRTVEVGDGQVSDLSGSVDPADLAGALLNAPVSQRH